MTDQESLPHFRRPPVAEVVCGIQFQPLKFKAAHFGLFAQAVRPDYPTTEDRPPLDDLLETEQGTQTRSEGLIFDLPPHRRVFYLDGTGNFLLQVQPSRFLSNWRKQRPSDEYPRFTTAFGRFKRGWSTFLSFAKENELGDPKTDQYELSYVNHVVGDDESFPEAIEKYIPLLSLRPSQSDRFLPMPHAAGVRLRFRFPEAKGRLHVTVGHGDRNDKPVLVLDLTARGSSQSDWSDMDEWFGMAHEWIVRGFAELTSEFGHTKWERER